MTTLPILGGSVQGSQACTEEIKHLKFKDTPPGNRANAQEGRERLLQMVHEARYQSEP